MTIEFDTDSPLLFVVRTTDPTQVRAFPRQEDAARYCAEVGVDRAEVVERDRYLDQLPQPIAPEWWRWEREPESEVIAEVLTVARTTFVGIEGEWVRLVLDQAEGIYARHLMDDPTTRPTGAPIRHTLEIYCDTPPCADLWQRI